MGLGKAGRRKKFLARCMGLYINRGNPTRGVRRLLQARALEKGGMPLKQKKNVERQEVLRRMLELAAGSANDAVKLAYLSGEDREAIDGLELGCLTEFRRNSNGTVEVKLTDRAAVLVKLLEQMKEEGGEGPAAFLRAQEEGGAGEGG